MPPWRTPSVRRLLLLAVVPVLAVPIGAYAAHRTLAVGVVSGDRPVTTSSNADTVRVGARSVDADPATEWLSAAGKNDQWLAVDLGGATRLTRVDLHWTSQYSRVYRVEVSSDAASWRTTHRATAGDGGTDSVKLDTTARHLRVYSEQRARPDGGIGLSDLRVHGARLEPDPEPVNPFTVVATGDIAERCDPAAAGCAHGVTARRVGEINPRFLLTLGDHQYDRNTLADFRAFYDKSWGKFKDITNPAPGNHEYYSLGARGYRDYFGDRAVRNGRTYYSFDEGGWHFVALDSEVQNAGGSAASEQLKWLRADLAANSRQCVAAYWHRPLYSSGEHGGNPAMAGLWQALYEARADLVLTGHDHHYERFAPQDAHGKADPAGIRSMVAGLGGASLYRLRTQHPNSEASRTGFYGVVKLNLADNAYSWQLVRGDDGSVADQTPVYGCH